MAQGMSRYPAHSALRRREITVSVNLPSCFLCVGGIQDFIPKRLRRVVAVLPLHHQAFEVAFLNQFKELQRATVDMTNKSNARRLTRDDRAKDLFPLKQRQFPQTTPVEPENIEGVVNGFAIPLQLGARITTQPNAGGSNPDTVAQQLTAFDVRRHTRLSNNLCP